MDLHLPPWPEQPCLPGYSASKQRDSPQSQLAPPGAARRAWSVRSRLPRGEFGEQTLQKRRGAAPVWWCAGMSLCSAESPSRHRCVEERGDA